MAAEASPDTPDHAAAISGIPMRSLVSGVETEGPQSDLGTPASTSHFSGPLEQRHPMRVIPPTPLSHPARSRRQLFSREPGWQFSLMLALDVVFLFVAVPALSAGDARREVVTSLQLLLAATAIALLAKSAWFRVVLATSFGLTLLSHLLSGPVQQATTLSVAFVYNLLVTGGMTRAIFAPGDVNHHRIAGAIFIYLNVALLFAIAYSGLMLAVPGAIDGFAASGRGHFSEIIHFSFTTLTAIGDGSIEPRSPFARSLTDLETITGQLFPAILLSRLVGLHLSKSR